MESFAKNSYLAQLLASTFKTFLYFGKRNFLIFPEMELSTNIYKIFETNSSFLVK